MKTCYIVGAGDFHKGRFRPSEEDLIIAADAGLLHLRRIGVRPQLIIGDFDSLGRVPSGEGVEVSPVEKDDTDMVIAVRRALELGCGRIFMFGALGGARLDHTLANIQTLAFAETRGAEAYLVGESVMTAISNRGLRFSGYEGGFSVFCLGESATGVYERGSKYPLENATLTADFPLGVSNEFAAPVTEIEVRSGTLIVYWQGNENRSLPEKI